MLCLLECKATICTRYNVKNEVKWCEVQVVTFALVNCICLTVRCKSHESRILNKLSSL